MALETSPKPSKLVPVRHLAGRGVGEPVSWTNEDGFLVTFVLPENTPPDTLVEVENPQRQGGLAYYLVVKKPLLSKDEVITVEALTPDRVRELQDKGKFNPLRVEPQLFKPKV